MLVYHRVIPSSKFASIHLYTLVSRGTVRVKNTTQCPQPRHPRKPRASTGTGREGRDWEPEKGWGRGGEGKGERGSPGKLLYTDHFSINYISEVLLASFLIKFKMKPMKSDHMLIWKSLRTRITAELAL